jgi:hypothetical protein
MSFVRIFSFFSTGSGTRPWALPGKGGCGRIVASGLSIGAQNPATNPCRAHASHTPLIRRGESDPFVRLGLRRGLFPLCLRFGIPGLGPAGGRHRWVPQGYLSRRRRWPKKTSYFRNRDRTGSPAVAGFDSHEIAGIRGAEFSSWWAIHQPTGADHEEVDECAALCSAKEDTQDSQDQRLA